MNGKEFFMAGCNYWASHAGTAMWHDWQPDTVEKDLETLAGGGLKILRVFPLWQDFQPVTKLHPEQYGLREQGNKRLPMALPEYYGLDPVMLERFHFLADTAQICGLKLIVGLINGLVNNRLFVPAALENRDLVRDPECIRMEVHFIRGFIASIVNHSTIIGWDLGNECDRPADGTRGTPLTEAETWNWVNAMASAVRLCDPLTPVIAGVHGGFTVFERPWSLFQLGELCDRLATCPSPSSTSCGNNESFAPFPASLHGTAGACFGAGVSGKPCFPEENASLEPMSAGGKAVIFSAWAHGQEMFLGWNAFRPVSPKHPTGPRIELEGEPVLFDSSRVPTATGTAVKEAVEFMGSLPCKNLPPRRTDAVVLLSSRSQNQERAGFGSFLLAKEAGFDVKIATMLKALPESDFYILPSFEGDCGLFPDYWNELILRVKKGAALFISDTPDWLRLFGTLLGCRVNPSHQEPGKVCFETSEGHFCCDGTDPRRLLAESCTVLGKEAGGNPVFIMNQLEKGRIFYLDVPIESHAADPRQEYYKIYKQVFRMTGKKRLIQEKDRFIGVTEHYTGDGNVFAVCINYSDRSGRVFLEGLPVVEVYPDSGERETILPDSMKIFKIKEPLMESEMPDTAEISFSPELISPADRIDWSKASASEVYTREALERKGRTVEVLFLGDSITHGWEWNRRWTHSGGYLAWDGPLAKYNKVNLGISGDKVENLLWRITKGRQVDGYKAKVISLMIGTNNLLSGEGKNGNLDNIAFTTGEIIRILRKKQPDAKILLQAVLPCKNAEVTAKTVLLNEKLIKLADGKTVFWLDMSRLFKDENGKLLHFRDTLHPSPEGYDILAAALIPEFDRLLC